jgi:hypothetical protein
MGDGSMALQCSVDMHHCSWLSACCCCAHVLWSHDPGAEIAVADAAGGSAARTVQLQLLLLLLQYSMRE